MFAPWSRSGEQPAEWRDPYFFHSNRPGAFDGLCSNKAFAASAEALAKDGLARQSPEFYKSVAAGLSSSHGRNQSDLCIRLSASPRRGHSYLRHMPTCPQPL